MNFTKCTLPVIFYLTNAACRSLVLHLVKLHTCTERGLIHNRWNWNCVKKRSLCDSHNGQNEHQYLNMWTFNFTSYYQPQQEKQLFSTFERGIPVVTIFQIKDTIELLLSVITFCQVNILYKPTSQMKIVLWMMNQVNLVTNLFFLCVFFQQVTSMLQVINDDTCYHAAIVDKGQKCAVCVYDR